MKRLALLAMLLLTGLAAAAPPTPTFRLSCDGQLTPGTDAAGTPARVSGPVAYIAGRTGQALSLPAGSTVSFPTTGVLSASAGTVALWTQRAPDAAEPARLFDCASTQSTLRLLSLPQGGAPFAAQAMALATSLLPPPAGDAQAIGESWQHLALTWGGGQVSFLLNGVTLCSAPLAGPLPALAEQFTLGGQGSAACTLDDLMLFDRALDSHELCALAGRAPGTDWSQANWLANSSFEVGPQPWQTYLWGDSRATAAPATGPCISGRHSLLVDRSLATDANGSMAWLLGPWLHLPRGREVTFSAWLRADVPAAEVNLELQVGSEPSSVRGTPPGGLVSSRLSVDQRWRRYNLTCALPVAYKDAYRPRIRVAGQPCRVWIDDVQMAAGPLRDYQPRTPVEIGLISSTGYALAETGDWLEPTLCAYAPLGTAKLITVNWGYRKPAPRNGFVAAEAAYFWLVPGQPASVRLRSWRLDTCGVWTVEAAHYGRAEARLAVAVTPYRRLFPPPATSPFGINGGTAALLSRFALTGQRDVGRYLWQWLEPREDAWSDDGRFAQTADDHLAGLTLTGTLGQAPAWASDSAGVPRDTERWSEYVRRTVAGNVGQVALWEPWPEPDTNPRLSAEPDLYVDLLRAAYAAQRAADPDARMIGPSVAGLTSSSFAFADRVFALGGLACLDQVAWQAVSHDEPEGPFLDGLRRINALVAEHGAERTLVLTDYGTGGIGDPSPHIPWSADAGRRWDADEQAALLVRQSVLALWQGATRLHWSTLDEERLTTGPDALGLVRADTYGTPKPALLALSHMARLLGEAQLPPQQLRPRPGAWAFRFETPLGHVACYWDPNGPSPPTWSTAATVYDLYGNTVPRGQWRLRPEPQWVVWQSNSTGSGFYP